MLRAAHMVVRLAVVGCGAWGINHVRAASQLDDAELAMVCDASSKARERALAVAPEARAVESAAEVFRDPSIDAVIIAAPAPSHAPLTLGAVEAGKHVLVEKPFVLDPRDGARIVEEAARRGRTLMVGHLLRYHPYFRRLEAMVKSGELGRPYYVYSERVNLGPVRADENALWSLAPHDVSMMCALMNERPVEITAVGHGYLRPGVEDVVFATLRFADDTLGKIHLSWLDPRKRRRLTVVGSDKLAVFDDMEPTEKLRIYDAAGAVGLDPSVAAREGDVHAPVIPMQEPLAAEQQQFIHCIVTQKTPETDGEEGMRVTRCLVAAHESLKNGGKPVRIG